MELILYENAKRAVAQLQEFDEIREHLDKAAAVQEYARRAKDKDLEVHAAEYRVYCERRVGEMLNARPGRQSFNSETLTAEDAGIQKTHGSRCRELADIPTDAFDDAVAVLKADDKPPTRKRVMDVHYSSQSPEHCTPDAIIELVMQVLEDITLDPCADKDKNVPAEHHFTIEENGLLQNWFGTVYMNPPYGSEIKQWVCKLHDEYEFGKVRSAIALVPARTDTAWFNRLSDYRVCFIRGRLKFKGNREVAPFPSAVIYLGSKPARFKEIFSEIGTIWKKL